jgi:hypothetical protein
MRKPARRRSIAAGHKKKTKQGEISRRGKQMSTDDYLVDPLRDLQVREHAKTLRHFLGRDDDERIDPLELETATEIWTVRGKRPFRLEIVPDAECLAIPG